MNLRNCSAALAFALVCLAPVSANAVEPDGLKFEPDDVRITASDTILLFSREHRSLFMFNPQQNAYTRNIGLGRNPTFMTYDKVSNYAFVGYEDRRITRVDITNSTESNFVSIIRDVRGLEMVGSYILAVDSWGSRYTHYTLDTNGQFLSFESGKRRSDQFEWSLANRRVYHFDDDNKLEELIYETISTAGVVSDGEFESNDRDLDEDDLAYPIRVSPDGNRVILGSGVIVDGTTLKTLGYLPNEFEDLHFRPDGSVAAIGRIGNQLVLQEYNAELELTADYPIPGSFGFVVGNSRATFFVWDDGGVPRFGVWNAGSDDFDGDGTPNGDDAFPLDPSETLDIDNDGIGNNADPDDDNDGVPDTSDLFPWDPTESKDFDSDGTGDNADPDDDNDGVNDDEDAFPFDQSESLDTDEDGIGNNADNDDDNDGVPDSEDEVPLDPTESRDFDKDGTGDNADIDDDNDGVEDSKDLWPFDASEAFDNDADGTGDNADPDDDNDQMPDTWENAYGLNPFDASDAAADPDGDGLSNLEEFNRGSDPNAQPASRELLVDSGGGGGAGPAGLGLLLLALAARRKRRAERRQTL